MSENKWTEPCKLFFCQRKSYQVSNGKKTLSFFIQITFPDIFQDMKEVLTAGQTVTGRGEITVFYIIASSE